MTSQLFYQSALVLLVLALVTIKEAQGAGCPAGTIEMNNKCFWRGAEADGCTAHAGGKLAVLPTAKDVKDAASHLKGLFVDAGNPVELKIALVRTGRKWHWVGFNRKENNNKCWRDNSHKKPPIKRCASAEYDNADKKVYFLPRKCDVNGDCLCYVELPKDDDGGETNNDPHFLITSLDSDNTHFCFDVDGGDDDVLQLLQDPDHKLQVNGQLFESQGTFHHAFFSAIAIMYGDDEIISTKDNITINGDRTVQWDDSYSIDLDNQGSVSSLDKSTAWIELASDIQMEITRTKTSDNDSYLGFFLTHSGGIGDRAKGVMGKFIGSKFSAVQSTDKHSQWMIEFSQLPISVPVNQLTRYSHSHQKRIQCWHYKVDTDASEDALLGKRTEYTVDDLEYTPF